MMAYELRLSAEAKRCVQEQLQWYEADEANGGAELADRWLDLIETAFDALVQHPERHGFALKIRVLDARNSIRHMRFEPWKTASAWRILYVLDEQAIRVTTVQVRHEKRPLLSDEG